MKKIAFYLILVLVTKLPATAQSFKIFKGDTINVTDAKGMKQGEWKRFYDNDQLFSVTKFKNGKPVGSTLTYYKTGEKQGELLYEKDDKTARMTSYWPNGKLKAKGKYISQEKDSIWNYFNENSTLSAVETYKAGKAVGVWKVYYQDGKISEEVTYANGKKNGPFKYYFPDGTIKTTGNYKDDSIDGMIVHFHLNGKPLVKGQFSNGLKTGEWIYSNDKGIKDSTEIYINGKLKE